MKSKGEMSKSSILLINPLVNPLAPYKNAISLGLASLAAFLRDKRAVNIIEMDHLGLDLPQAIDMCRDYSAIGITAMSFQMGNALALAREISSNYPEKFIFLGGVAPSLMKEYCLSFDFIDGICRGEGEYALYKAMELVDQWGGDRISFRRELGKIPGFITKSSQNSNMLIPMEELPFPARDLLPSGAIIPKDGAFMGRRSGIVMFSRGCPFSCSYCAVPSLWGVKIRRRKPEQAILEIQQIRRDYGIDCFAIEDDCFTADPRWVQEFCGLLRPLPPIEFRINAHANTVDKDMLLSLKKAGCIKVTYGVESVDPKIRKISGKVLDLKHLEDLLKYHREIGLSGATLFMLGLPGENQDSIRANLDWLAKHKPNGHYDFQIAQPHPGSAFSEMAPDYGQILSYDPDDYFSDHITFLPRAFQLYDFARLCAETCNRVIKIAGKAKKCAKSREVCDGSKNMLIELDSEFISCSFVPFDGPPIAAQYCGENVKIALEKEIWPQDWHRICWRDFGGHWTGSERCRSGLGLVKADGPGQIEYRGEIQKENGNNGAILGDNGENRNNGDDGAILGDNGDNEAIRKNNKNNGNFSHIIVTARLASHHYHWPIPPVGASLVELLINGFVVGRQLVHSIHTTGRRVSFIVPCQLWKNGLNSIVFRVPKGPYSNGLALFTTALNPFFQDIQEGIRLYSLLKTDIA